MMNKKYITAILIYVLAVFIASVSQILLKKSAMKHHDSRIKEYVNLYTAVAYSIFFASSLLTVYAYATVPLSLGTALESLGYLFIAVMDKFILKQRIGKKKCLGILIIITGIYIVCLN